MDATVAVTTQLTVNKYHQCFNDGRSRVHMLKGKDLDLPSPFFCRPYWDFFQIELPSGKVTRTPRFFFSTFSTIMGSEAESSNNKISQAHSFWFKAFPSFTLQK